MASTLKNNNKFIAIEGDKNVGGCFLSRDTYNARGISEHLGDTNVYRLLTKVQAQNHMCILRFKYDIFVGKWFDLGQLSKAE